MRSRIFPFLISLSLLVSFCNCASAQVAPKALRQIQLLLREKASRTPSQRKMDSRLLQASRERRGVQMVAGVQLRPAKINADIDGKLKVDIKANVTTTLLARLNALGATIIYASEQYKSVRALVNLSSVETIAAYPEVSFIQPAVRSLTIGAPDSVHHNLPKLINRFPGLRLSFAQRSANVRTQLLNYLQAHNGLSTKPFSGTVASQGDRTHRADDARNAYGFAGEGIRIGVLSDSYNALGGVAADIQNGELPGTGNPLGNTTAVTVLADNPDGEDEGRAMLQIVHDLAPKAQLFFATADISEASFAANIQSLRAAPNNCDIIIDDVFYYDEPVFQDGQIAQAVNAVTADGALYFSSAGNEGSVAKNTAGYFEGDFNDAGSAPFISSDSTKTGTVHNFGSIAKPLNGDMVTSVGFGYTLNWADATGASNNDYDLFLINKNDSIKASSTNIQDGTQDPFEQIDPPTFEDSDRLVVFKNNSAAPRAFALNTIRGTLTVVTTGQTHGHSAAVAAFSVAATPAAASFTGSNNGPYPLAFSITNKVESFSSDGPRRMFYNADGTAITPGNFLFKTNGGNVRNKPDITAADGVKTSLAANQGLNPFYGTSAAAPHAGAIAALLKSANPALTATQVRSLITSTALDIETPGYDINSGFGIVQAYQAMQLLNPTPISTVTQGFVTVTEGTFSNNNGSIDPGELGKLVVQLIDPSNVVAGNVTAILKTSTPGISITQDSASYGSIGIHDSVINLLPFRFAVNSSVGCGTVIAFTLTVSFTGGVSPKTFSINIPVGSQPFTTIANRLGKIPVTNGFTFTTGTQTGRVTRNAPVSSCDSQKLKPVIFSTKGARTFDAYKFTNKGTISQCVSVTLAASDGLNLYAVAYNNAGFIPTITTTNYLADQGFSGTVQSFSFNAPAGKSFTIVVHEINPATAVDSAYTLSVNLSACAIGPVCSPVIISNPFTSGGDTSTLFNKTIAASGGSGNYNFSLAGILPTGLSFVDSTISGLPKQSGIFPITITATDVAGCPAAIQNDTLTILAAITYVFNGNGNWTDSSNWVNNLVPPATLITGSQVVIDPVLTGACILDIPYTLSPGCFMTVEANKNFVIQGNLTLHQ